MLLELGGGLEVTARRNSPWQSLTSPHGRLPVAVRVDETERRCRLGLMFFDGARIVEVSRDPEAWFGALRTAANSAGQHPERWTAAAATGLDRFGVNNGWWPQRRTGRPEHISLAATYPLLRNTSFAADDCASLPRWAARLCEAPDVRNAAHRALGHRTSRRVTRLIGEKLSGRPRWWPLAVVLAMPRLETGQIGDILSGLDHEFRCNDSQFALLAATLGTARTDHAMQLLQSTARDATPQRLLAGLDGLARAGHLVTRLPTTISALEEVVAVALQPQPPPTQPSPRHHRPAGVTTRDAPTLLATTPRRSPAASTGGFNHPASWTRLHGATIGNITLVLPASRVELGRWGRQLNNCLADYKTTVANGQRLLLGIQVDGRLAGAVEVDPARRLLVQIEAANNRPLPRETRQTVTALLHAGGAIDLA